MSHLIDAPMDIDTQDVERLRTVSPGEIRATLAAIGTDIGSLPRRERATDADAYDFIPLRAGWLRLGIDEADGLLASWVRVPTDPESRLGPEFTLEREHAALDGFLRVRADIDGDAVRMLSVHRPPDREAYVAVIHDRSSGSPALEGAFPGIYPDAVLAGSAADRVAYVRPSATANGRTEVVVAPVSDNDPVEQVLMGGDAAEMTLSILGDRRFLGIEYGPKVARRTALTDLDQDRPRLMQLPDPIPASLVTVVTGARPSIWVAQPDGGDWLLRQVHFTAANRPRYGAPFARGAGLPLRLTASSRDAVLLHVADRDHPGERLVQIPLAAPDLKELISTEGAIRLGPQPMPADVGWTAVDINGAGPRMNFWDRSGMFLGRTSRSEASPTTWMRETVTSDDGYRFVVEARWPGTRVSFSGPVLLLLYGAYGTDIKMDADPELGLWHDAGFAVATAHIRGGAGERHAAGARGNRHRSVADAQAALSWLRRGSGRLRPTSITALGASAGGFLVASLVARQPEDLDLGIIVNGYVDPLGSLESGASRTASADRAEWGDPADPDERRVLEEINPMAALSRMPAAPSTGPHVLMVIAGHDVRVDPRQGLEWYLRYRRLGHRASLWHDPDGTHDRWGVNLSPRALPEWAAEHIPNYVERTLP